MRDGLGTQWRDAIGYVTDESGQQDRVVRHMSARRLISNGFADRGAFRSVMGVYIRVGSTRRRSRAGVLFGLPYIRLPRGIGYIGYSGLSTTMDGLTTGQLPATSTPRPAQGCLLYGPTEGGRVM